MAKEAEYVPKNVQILLSTTETDILKIGKFDEVRSREKVLASKIYHSSFVRT